jgi:hypothetical protein
LEFTMRGTKGLTLGDVIEPGTTVDLAELHAIVHRAQAWEARQGKVKALRARYGQPKLRTKALARPARRPHQHCSCNGSCRNCQSEAGFTRCHALGEELTKLDLAIALTRQEMQIGAIAKQTKAALDSWQGKSIDDTPSVDETVLRTKLLTLGWEWDAVWNEMAAAGCQILRKDRVGAA